MGKVRPGNTYRVHHIAQRFGLKGQAMHIYEQICEGISTFLNPFYIVEFAICKMKKNVDSNKGRVVTICKE